MDIQPKIYTVEEISRILSPVFERSGVVRAVLFGSYAKNLASQDSDIDIVVEVEDWVDDLDFCGISVDVSDSIGKEIDFLALSDFAVNSATHGEIKEGGRVIYEKIR
jgi:predicted nucleotidyltransferase